MSIGENIKKARKAAKLTQAELAEKCEVATITIRQYENNTREPSYDRLQKIASALNTTGAALQGYKVFDSAEEFEAAWVAGGGAPHPGTPLYRINRALDKLNDTGQSVAAERVEELTKIPEYQK